MSWVKLTDSVSLFEIERTNLDYLSIEIFFILLIGRVSILHVFIVAHLVHEHFLTYCRHNEIKDWNNVSWVVYNLSVQRWIELEYVLTVDVQNQLFNFTHFLKLLQVEWLCRVLSFIIGVIALFYESVDEVFDFHLHFISIDVCTPEHLSVTWWLCVVVHLVEETCWWHTIWCTLHHVRILSTWVEHGSFEKSVYIEESTLLLEVGHHIRSIQNRLGKLLKITESW